MALTLVTTGFPFSDRCLSTYAEDSRSLEAERRVKRLLTLAKSCVPLLPPHSSVSHSLRALGSSLYTAELQSIRAANYDQHSVDEAISSTQTQLHTSRPRRNEHVFVYLKNKGVQKGRTQAELGGREGGTNEEHMKDSWGWNDGKSGCSAFSAGRDK